MGARQQRDMALVQAVPNQLTELAAVLLGHGWRRTAPFACAPPVRRESRTVEHMAATASQKADLVLSLSLLLLLSIMVVLLFMALLSLMVLV